MKPAYANRGYFDAHFHCDNILDTIAQGHDAKDSKRRYFKDHWEYSKHTLEDGHEDAPRHNISNLVPHAEFEYDDDDDRVPSRDSKWHQFFGVIDTPEEPIPDVEPELQAVMPWEEEQEEINF